MTKVDLGKVVDHEIRWAKAVDRGGVAPLLGHLVPEGRKIDQGSNTGEVLEDHSTRMKEDVGGGRRFRRRAQNGVGGGLPHLGLVRILD